MTKYSLWISSDRCNPICIPLSRDNQLTKEKVNLYEIDLLTASLGKEKFIKELKKTGLLPHDFDWCTMIGYIEYNISHKKRWLPLLFEKDKLILQMLTIQNQYRHHEGKTEAELITLLTRASNDQFKKLKSLLVTYSEHLIEGVRANPHLLYHQNMPKEVASKVHRYIESDTYDEKIEYSNEIIKKLFSYINFRKIKTVEYECQIEMYQKIENQLEEDAYEPDKDAFLTDEEWRDMYGYCKK